MKFECTGRFGAAPRVLMQRAGYAHSVTRKGKESYVRRLRGAEFPRFHVYLDDTNNGFTVSIHLDQKGACYESTSAHSGEYDGELVEKEAKRIAWEIMKHKRP